MPKSHPILHAVIGVLRENPFLKVNIQAHVNGGNPKVNSGRVLSMERATTIQEFICKRIKNPSRINAEVSSKTVK
jgi:hypothetical protein